MRVFNQFTEQWSVNQLAEVVRNGGKKFVVNTLVFIPTIGRGEKLDFELALLI